MTLTPSADLPVRRHDIGGTYNLRDVGGYRAATGTTRWGKLFRSDALHRLDESGRELLAPLGIRQIVDLRDESEVASAPSRLDGLDVTVRHLPIFDEVAPERLALVGATLASVYEQMIDRCAGNLVRAIRVIADSGDEPVLVHCTAGKDRTGVVIALALLAAGVDRADVIADYAATEENLRGEWADAMRARVASMGGVVSPDLDELISASPAGLLEQIIERIDAHHGSVVGYLRGAGLDDAALARLREALVEPDGGL